MPLGGIEPPSPPYERGARSHLRYSDIGKALGSPTRIPSTWRCKFLQVPHLYPCHIVYGHYPMSGYGLISLTVFMLKLRGQGRARTSDLRVNSHRILLIAVRLSFTKSHSIRRSKPSELPVQIEYILTFTVILQPIVVISID